MPAKKIIRSSVSGKFVSKETAKQNKATTYTAANKKSNAKAIKLIKEALKLLSE